MTRHTGWAPARTFFTSDLHLGHANIIRLAGRPFLDVDEMDRGLIRAINERVAPTDTLWVLGDFSFRIPVEEAYALRQEINCRDVRLVTGNHDKDWAGQPEPYSSCFSEVHELGHVLHLDKGAVEPPRSRKVTLCHYPMASWDGSRHGAVHLHGHIHSVGSGYNERMRSLGVLRYDVGVDANGYAPVSLEEVLAWFDGVEGRAEVHGDLDAARDVSAVPRGVPGAGRRELCEICGYSITYRDDNVSIEDTSTAEAVLFDNDGNVLLNNFRADPVRTAELMRLFRKVYPSIVEFRRMDADGMGE